MATCTLKLRVEWAWWWSLAKWPAIILIQFKASERAGLALVEKAMRVVVA